MCRDDKNPKNIKYVAVVFLVIVVFHKKIKRYKMNNKSIIYYTNSLLLIYCIIYKNE